MVLLTSSNHTVYGARPSGLMHHESDSRSYQGIRLSFSLLDATGPEAHKSYGTCDISYLYPDDLKVSNAILTLSYSITILRLDLAFIYTSLSPISSPHAPDRSQFSAPLLQSRRRRR